jgi:hypothetical protein
MLSLNKPCICGSGKQYKRCCVNKPNVKTPITNKILKKSIKSISDFIEIVDYPSKLFKMRVSPKKDIPFVRNLSKLPLELKDKISLITKKFPPNDSECVRYSQFISSSIEGVKVEVGLYKLDDLKNVFEGSVPQKNGWYNLSEGLFRTQSYIEDGEVWGIHCWNSYNDIHFDCMKDLLIKKRCPNQWIEYKNIDSISMEFEKQSLKENSINLIKKDILNFRYFSN